MADDNMVPFGLEGTSTNVYKMFKHKKLDCIPKMIQKLVFGSIGYAAHFLPSLAPCACTMVARSRQKICAIALPNFQLLNYFRYIAFCPPQTIYRMKII